MREIEVKMKLQKYTALLSLGNFPVCLNYIVVFKSKLHLSMLSCINSHHSYLCNYIYWLCSKLLSEQPSD